MASADNNKQQNERLDVESDDDREARIRDLLHRANSTASASFHSGPSSFDFGIRETHPVQPPTELLSRLQEFLPQMEAANTDLLQRARDDPDSVDIEHHSATGPYIQMNLGLGVFAMQRRDGSERSQSSSDKCSSSEDETTDSDSESDTHSSQDSAIGGDADGEEDHVLNCVSTLRPTRPLPKRSRPSIVVLNEAHEPPPAPTN